jgi:hypothetical protein
MKPKQLKFLVGSVAIVLVLLYLGLCRIQVEHVLQSNRLRNAGDKRHGVRQAH